MEDLDAVDRTGHTLGFDPVADAERAKQQDQHATGEVRQAALQGQANRQAGGTDGGDERSGFHTDHRSDADDQQNLQDDVGQGTDKPLQCQVGVTQGQQRTQFLRHFVDQPPADGQGDDRQQHAAAVFHDHGDPGLGSLDQVVHFSIQIHLSLLFLLHAALCLGVGAAE
ncbi:hypothetical protein D3C78_1474510 [compost metagenome]